ncbi:Calcium-Dependent Secretion Activator 1 [Manis pentadactyla]|nr:Calcium-Dependent Secretion Activator 1 [Manis pentadactyla]
MAACTRDYSPTELKLPQPIPVRKLGSLPNQSNPRPRTQNLPIKTTLGFPPRQKNPNHRRKTCSAVFLARCPFDSLISDSKAHCLAPKFWNSAAKPSESLLL